MKKLFYLFLVAFIALFTACNNDDNESEMDNEFSNQLDEEKSSSHQYSVKEKNAMLEDYAKILASSMHNQPLRNLIKVEAQLMFDGDYDILANKLENILLPEINIHVKELLTTSYFQNSLKDTHLKSSSISGEEFLEKIKNAFPNLQVAVPIHCDEWDTESYIPLVAFIPFDYDEETATEVTAYDYTGKMHKLSLETEPEEPVIVVGRSERIDEQGNRVGELEGQAFIVSTDSTESDYSLKNAPYGPANLSVKHGAARQILLEWTDVSNENSYEVWRMQQGEAQFSKIATTVQNNNNYISNGNPEGVKVWYKVRAINNDGFSSWSPNMATTVSGRNDNDMLKIKRMKFSKSALKAVEKWISGAPEIRLRIVKGSVDGEANTVFVSGILEPKKRGDIQDAWWNKEVSLFPWVTDVHGTVLTFDWRESDWEDNRTFKISGSYEDKSDNGTIKFGGEAEFKNTKDGHHIGTTSVFWWQPKTQIYNLSGFEWQFVY